MNEKESTKDFSQIKIYRGSDWVMAVVPSFWQHTDKYLLGMSLKDRLIDSRVSKDSAKCEEVDYSVAEMLSGEEYLYERHPECRFIYAWLDRTELVERIIKKYNENRHLELFD